MECHTGWDSKFFLAHVSDLIPTGFDYVVIFSKHYAASKPIYVMIFGKFFFTGIIYKYQYIVVFIIYHLVYGPVFYNLVYV